MVLSTNQSKTRGTYLLMNDDTNQQYLLQQVETTDLLAVQTSFWKKNNINIWKKLIFPNKIFILPLIEGLLISPFVFLSFHALDSKGTS